MLLVCLQSVLLGVYIDNKLKASCCVRKQNESKVRKLDYNMLTFAFESITKCN